MQHADKYVAAKGAAPLRSLHSILAESPCPKGASPPPLRLPLPAGGLLLPAMGLAREESSHACLARSATGLPCLPTGQSSCLCRSLTPQLRPSALSTSYPRRPPAALLCSRGAAEPLLPLCRRRRRQLVRLALRQRWVARAGGGQDCVARIGLAAPAPPVGCTWAEGLEQRRRWLALQGGGGARGALACLPALTRPATGSPRPPPIHLSAAWPVARSQIGLPPYPCAAALDVATVPSLECPFPCSPCACVRRVQAR